VKAEHAAGKSRVYAKYDRHSNYERESEGEVEWASNGGGKLEWQYKTQKQGDDKYVATWKLNSAKLNLDHHEGKVAFNMPNKQFEVDIKDGKGNLVSGR